MDSSGRLSDEMSQEPLTTCTSCVGKQAGVTRLATPWAHLRNRGPLVSKRPGADSLVAGPGLPLASAVLKAGCWDCIAAARAAALKERRPALSRGRLNTSHFSNATPAQQQQTAFRSAARHKLLIVATSVLRRNISDELDRNASLAALQGRVSML